MTSRAGSRPASELERVVVEVTGRCNHSCRHCYNFWEHGRNRPGQEAELSRSEILELVRKIGRDTPLSQVALSGGEPMLRGDLPEIVADLHEEGLSVAVITNGTLLTAERLHRFPPEILFELTLFSFDANVHNRLAGAHAFERVLESGTLIEQQGHKLAVALVVTRQNSTHVFKTIELGIALGASAFLFNRVNLGRQALPIAAELVPTAEMLGESLASANDAAAKYGVAVAVSVPVPPCVVDPGDFPDLHFGWCPRGGPDSYYTIGCTGLVRPCNHSSVVLGDLRSESFADIVSGRKTAGFWASFPEECIACKHPLRDRCRGGCPAAADECLGTPTRRDPFVELALGRR